jgi:hypothetical protein
MRILDSTWRDTHKEDGLQITGANIFVYTFIYMKPLGVTWTKNAHGLLLGVILKNDISY